MELLINERQAISDLVTGLGQLEFDALLGRTGACRVSDFSSVMSSMPVVAIGFLDWLPKHDAKGRAVLVALADGFRKHPSTPVVAQLLARLSRAQAAGSSALPWEVHLVGGVPIVNRVPLRRTLDDLTQGHYGPIVSMVDGPAGSGRSHSWHLISYVARSLTGVRPVKIDLEAAVVEQRTLEATVQELVRKLGLTGFTSPTVVGATPETVAARYAEEVATAWASLPAATRSWIAFDSLDRPVAPEIRRFICALAQLSLDHQLHGCSMFLLGAGRDYGISDPYLVVRSEALSVFLKHEVERTAHGLNALGAAPLTPDRLKRRVVRICKTLKSEDTRVVFREISAGLAELRVEVRA